MRKRARPDPAAWKKADRPAIRRYLLVFAGAAAGLFGVYWTAEVTGKFQHVNLLNAALSGAVLRACGFPTERTGTVLQFERGGMEIISECSGVYVAILFAAAVLAFPTSWRARGWGLALGLVALFAVNVVRLVTVGMVIAWRESLFPLVHEYLWQILFVLVVALLYVAWIEKTTPRASPAEEGSP